MELPLGRYFADQIKRDIFCTEYIPGELDVVWSAEVDFLS
jgi:hypothetical protein